MGPLRGARRAGGKLGLAWQPGDFAEVGPFEGRDREDAAEQLAAMMDLLRERSLAAGAPGREPRNRLVLPWPAITTYVAVCAAAFVLAAR